MTLASSEYFLHPNFNPSTLNNDIGLIRLRMEIEFSDWIKPISAPPTSSLPDESYLRAIGWGQTTDRKSKVFVVVVLNLIFQIILHYQTI